MNVYLYMGHVYHHTEVQRSLQKKQSKMTDEFAKIVEEVLHIFYFTEKYSRYLWASKLKMDISMVQRDFE